MITAERKPMEEIIECVKPYQPHHTGRLQRMRNSVRRRRPQGSGHILSSALQMAFMKEGRTLEVKEDHPGKAM